MTPMILLALVLACASPGLARRILQGACVREFHHNHNSKCAHLAIDAPAVNATATTDWPIVFLRPAYPGSDASEMKLSYSDYLGRAYNDISGE